MELSDLEDIFGRLDSIEGVDSSELDQYVCNNVKEENCADIEILNNYEKRDRVDEIEDEFEYGPQCCMSCWKNKQTESIKDYVISHDDQTWVESDHSLGQIINDFMHNSDINKIANQYQNNEVTGRGSTYEIAHGHDNNEVTQRASTCDIANQHEDNKVAHKDSTNETANGHEDSEVTDSDSACEIANQHEGNEVATCYAANQHEGNEVAESKTVNQHEDNEVTHRGSTCAHCQVKKSY